MSSGKTSKKIRQLARRDTREVYKSLKSEINGLNLKSRCRIAWLILRGRW